MNEPRPPSTRSASQRAARLPHARAAVWLAASLALATACTSKGAASEAPAPERAPKVVKEPAAKAESPKLPLSVPGSSANVLRFELASGIVEREPVGIARRFEKQHTPRVYAFLEVSNEGTKPVELGVAFEPVESDEVSTMLTLDIPAHQKRWRTQAFMNATWPGDYRAVLVGPDDEELAILTFELAP